MKFLLTLMYSDVQLKYETTFTQLVDDVDHPTVTFLQKGMYIEMGEYGTLPFDRFFGTLKHGIHNYHRKKSDHGGLYIMGCNEVFAIQITSEVTVMVTSEVYVDADTNLDKQSIQIFSEAKCNFYYQDEISHIIEAEIVNSEFISETTI